MPTSTCTSGVLENNLDAIHEIMTNPLLIKITVWSLFASLVVNYLALYMIHMTNALQKIMLALLKTILMWVFFMAYPGEGHEDWNWTKALGMLLLVIGTLWYIKLDI